MSAIVLSMALAKTFGSVSNCDPPLPLPPAQDADQMERGGYEPTRLPGHRGP